MKLEYTVWPGNALIASKFLFWLCTFSGKPFQLNDWSICSARYFVLIGHFTSHMGEAAGSRAAATPATSELSCVCKVTRMHFVFSCTEGAKKYQTRCVDAYICTRGALHCAFAVDLAPEVNVPSSHGVHSVFVWEGFS